jgi:hypothetical protein
MRWPPLPFVVPGRFLQWGHATMGVENCRRPPLPLVVPGRFLQWGHATMGVESIFLVEKSEKQQQNGVGRVVVF